MVFEDSPRDTIHNLGGGTPLEGTSWGKVPTSESDGGLGLLEYGDRRAEQKKGCFP